MINPSYWWEAFPIFFPVACWMAAQYPDDMNRMRAKKQWKDKDMGALYRNMYDLWLVLNEEEESEVPACTMEGTAGVHSRPRVEDHCCNWCGVRLPDDC